MASKKPTVTKKPTRPTPARSTKTAAKTSAKSAPRESGLYVQLTVYTGEVVEVPIEEGMSLGALLEDRGVNTDGFDLYVNGNDADLETVLQRGDLVQVAPRVKAGR